MKEQTRTWLQETLADIAKRREWSCFHLLVKSSGLYQLLATREKREGVAAQFSLTQLPGCCGVMVSFHAHVLERIRRMGLGRKLTELRERLAKDQGYSYILAIVTGDNEAQMKVMDKQGWKKLDTFQNFRTAHIAHIYGKFLREGEVCDGTSK